MSCQHIAIACTDVPVRRVYLDNVPKGQDLCEPCITYAAQVGMHPVADRRSAPRIPEWRKHNLAKVLDHGRGAA
jgi:hypothetical protein